MVHKEKAFTMKKISLALIGDIHYPDNKSDSSAIDIKDTGLDPRIISTIAPIMLKKVSDELNKQLNENDSIRAVLLSGDLTSKGDIDGYKECLDYLQKVLNLSDVEFWKDKHLHVVPGNHDISRDTTRNADDIYAKFDEIKQAWLDISRDEMLPGSVRFSDIQINKSKARIFSVNSCVGCGEKRYLPQGICSELENLFGQFKKTNGSDKAFELVSEQLDTPVIDDNHISFIGNSIRELKKSCDIPVLLAHHSLLPQVTPRIQIYTELLNSGHVRFALASLAMPIIYCHGHLHDDSVEIVTQPQHGSGKIIIISAPLFIDGFNLINLIFNNEGESLGCEVIPIRLKHGSIVFNETIRIPLLTNSNMIDGILREALDSTNDSTQRFKQIFNKMNLTDEICVSNALLELEWMGLLEIQNRQEDPRYWQIRRTSP